MKILDLQIERDLQDQHFCGTLDYVSYQGQIGTLLWTLQDSQNKIEVAFVQGSDPDWDQLAQFHSRYLTDHLILAVARRRKLQALVPNEALFAPVKK